MQDWPQNRLESGFYRDIRPLQEIHASSSPRTFTLLGTPHTSVSHTLSAGLLADDSSLVIYEVTALAHLDDDPAPAAYATFDVLVERPGRTVDEADFVTACEAARDDLGEAAAALLSNAAQGIHSVLSCGSVAYLSRLEVRADCVGTQLGARLLTGMAALLAVDRNAGLLVVKPFPLQFESCAPAQHAPDHPAFQRVYTAARERLVRFYCDVLGGAEVPGLPGYVISPLGGAEIVADEYGWSVESAVARGAR